MFFLVVLKLLHTRSFETLFPYLGQKRNKNADEIPACSRRLSRFALKLLHLRPQGLDRIEGQTVSWPTGEKLDHVGCATAWLQQQDAPEPLLVWRREQHEIRGIFFAILN